MNSKPLVLMTHPLPEDWIGSALDGYRVILDDSGQKGIQGRLRDQLGQAAGIFCLLDDPIPAEVLENASVLKVVSNMAVGVDNIDLAACTRLGIPVGHTPGVLTDGTADLTVALLLAVCRKLLLASEDARQGRWSTWDPTGWLGADLKDATVGIFGLGKIGFAVGNRLAAFGSRILFTNRSPKPVEARSLKARQVELDELLEESDFLCLHASLNEQTQELFDHSAFEVMKPSAILINAARGPVVKTDDLLHALREGQIRAAGLDVTDPEPLPPQHPLYQQENCLITPHIGSATFGTRKAMAKIALRNLSLGIAGEPLDHCANPEVYSLLD